MVEAKDEEESGKRGCDLRGETVKDTEGADVMATPKACAKGGRGPEMKESQGGAFTLPAGLMLSTTPKREREDIQRKGFRWRWKKRSVD